MTRERFSEGEHTTIRRSYLFHEMMTTNIGKIALNTFEKRFVNVYQLSIHIKWYKHEKFNEQYYCLQLVKKINLNLCRHL